MPYGPLFTFLQQREDEIVGTVMEAARRSGWQTGSSGGETISAEDWRARLTLNLASGWLCAVAETLEITSQKREVSLGAVQGFVDWANDVYREFMPGFESSSAQTFFFDWYNGNEDYLWGHPSTKKFAAYYFEWCDQQTGSNTLETYHAVQLVLAKSIIGADGRVTEREKAYIDELHKRFHENELGYVSAREDAGADGSELGHPLPLRRSADESKKELDALVGLATIKMEMRRLEALLTINQKRKSAGLSTTSMTYHYIFKGNPGTGKTTVARIFGDLLREYGVLKNGHVIETDRSGLVAEFLGQTAVKTSEKVREAMDGVLFIDEAYTLSQDEINGADAYGSEAIDTVLKRMEDNRDCLVVIAAGYPAKMEKFLQSNPGLKSRFTRSMHFDDYSPSEMYEIFTRLAEKNDYRLNSDARLAVILIVHAMYAKRDYMFGNARNVRTLFEEALSQQAMRIFDEGGEITKERLHVIEADDLPLGQYWDVAAEKLTKLKWRFTCSECRSVHEVQSSHFGKKGVCNQCKKQVSINWVEPA